MDDVPEELLAQHEAELQLMADALRQAGMDTRLLEAGPEVPLPTLLVALGTDEADRDRTLGLSIMPFGDDGFEATDLLQFYVQLPFSVDEDNRRDVMAATAEVNAQMAIGHIAVRGDEVYYRYVLASPNDATVDGDMLVEVVQLVAFHQEHFGDYVEGVATGEIALQVLAEVLSQTS